MKFFQILNISAGYRIKGKLLPKNDLARKKAHEVGHEKQLSEVFRKADESANVARSWK